MAKKGLTFGGLKHEEPNWEGGIQEKDIIKPLDSKASFSSQKNKLPFEPEKMNVHIPLNKLDEAPSEWNFYPLPDVDTLTLIAQSIYHQGQLTPALVWEQQNGSYMILGGHTRFRVLNYLNEHFPDKNFGTMICHVYTKDQLDNAAARYLIVLNNMTQRARESISMQVKAVVTALNLQKQLKKDTWGKIKGESRHEIAESFGLSDSKVSRLYTLRLLIPEYLSLIDKETVSSKFGIKIATLPAEVQKCLYNYNILAISSFTEDGWKYLFDHADDDNAENVVETALNIKQDGYKCGKLMLSKPMPRGAKKITVKIPKKDYDAVISKFRDDIMNMKLSSEDVRTILLEQLR